MSVTVVQTADSLMRPVSKILDTELVLSRMCDVWPFLQYITEHRYSLAKSLEFMDTLVQTTGSYSSK